MRFNLADAQQHLPPGMTRSHICAERLRNLIMNYNSFEELPDETPEPKGISSPANQSLIQSYYIAALDRHLGLRGLISPVEASGMRYDFFHVESGRLVKVFKSLTEVELDTYAKNDIIPKPLFIIDADGLPTESCGHCEREHCDIESELVWDTVAVLDALLYMNQTLWECSEDDEEDLWIPITPVERARCIDKLFNMNDE